MAKITRIEIIPLRVPYFAPVSISQGTIDEARNVIVKMYCGDKMGVGEASPFIQTYSRENQPGIVSVLSGEIAPRLLGEDVFNIEKIHQLMDRIAPGHSCAKSAVDIALHDLAGRLLDVPVYQLIGGVIREEIPVWFALNEAEAGPKIAQQAGLRVDQGFRGIMVKIGKGIEEDEKTIRLVRQRIGEGIPIIADPNEAYSVPEAIDLTRQIHQYVQALEGPVAGTDISGLKNLRDLNLVTIIADESLFSPEDAITLVKAEAVDAFLIKLLKVGGFYRARQILGIARAAGTKCYAASMTNLGIGHAANLHFATASGLEDEFGFGFESLFQIFGDEEGIRKNDIADTPEFRHGFYDIPPGPGLGVSLIEQNVNKYAVKKIVCS